MQDHVLISHTLEGKSQEWPMVGGYLDVKVSVFQIQAKEPVPWANLQEDLFQRNHPEQPSHEGTVQGSKIEDRP